MEDGPSAVLKCGISKAEPAILAVSKGTQSLGTVGGMGSVRASPFKNYLAVSMNWGSFFLRGRDNDSPVVWVSSWGPWMLRKLSSVVPARWLQDRFTSGEPHLYHSHPKRRPKSGLICLQQGRGRYPKPDLQGQANEQLRMYYPKRY